MKSVNIYSKKDIEQFIKERVTKELDFVYEELKRLRVRLNDLEEIVTSSHS